MSSKAKTSGMTRFSGLLALALMVSLVVVVVAIAVVFRYAAQNERQDREYLSLLAQGKLMSQRLPGSAEQALRGDEAAFGQLRRQRDRFAQSMEVLEGGRGSSAGVDMALDTALKQWQELNTKSEVILKRQDALLELGKTGRDVLEQLGRLRDMVEEVATLMTQKGADAQQVYIAARQLMLVQRMEQNLRRVLAAADASPPVAERFGRDSALFGRVLDGLLNGNPGMAIERVRWSEVRAKLDAAMGLFNVVGEQVGAILEHSSELFAAMAAANGVGELSDGMLAALDNLESAYRGRMGRRLVSTTLGNLLVGVAAVLLILLGLQLRRVSRQRIAETEARRREMEEHNRRNQQAIMRLLDEMGELADGDLTVNATVTEDITGAIADSINYAVETMRDLVSKINDTTSQVSTAAGHTREIARRLSKASQHQTQQIDSVTSAVNDMASSIEEVAQHADESASEARTAVTSAKRGADAVQKTIDGMGGIREQIQQTAKRIRRLGESSQEIGEIIELINDIAEQTNILALNAAIQAAMAGDSGRGFAVVADEVQQLAERSGDATRQIELLVKTIQSDTKEAVVSMERTTSEVVLGTELAEHAGEALEEIDTVSARLAALVQSISAATAQQAAAAGNVSSTMKVIQTISTQTARGTAQTAASIGHLNDLAADLQRSVSGFKLPEEASEA